MMIQESKEEDDDEEDFRIHVRLCHDSDDNEDTILALYLNQVLNYSEDTSTVLYHLFVMLSYLTCIPGSIIADNYWGKFRTIFYLSIVYTIGSTLLAVAAIDIKALPIEIFSFLGLLLIAIGTGGIKPCVSAFGGDQFVVPQQQKELEQFFSIFYFSVNAGSLVSTFITPIFREDISCFDEDTCYPLAFGIPAILMIVALVIFLLGKPGYKIVAPQGNIVVDVAACITNALKNKMFGKKKEVTHWIDYADATRFDEKLVKDVKAVLRVLYMYIPVPIFWALFDQQLKIESTYPVELESGRAGLFLINTGDSLVTIKDCFDDTKDWELGPGDIKEFEELKGINNFTKCAGLPNKEFNIFEKKVTTVWFYKDQDSQEMYQPEEFDDNEKSKDGKPRVRFLYHSPQDLLLRIIIPDDDNIELNITRGEGATEYVEDIPGNEKVTFELWSNDDIYGKHEWTGDLGGVYNLLLEITAKDSVKLTEVEITEPNSVHMFWQIPQYFMITFGEVLFSPTGLEFSFTQSPKSMKSVITAAWLVAVSMGNLVVIVLAEASIFEKQSFEFFAYGGLLVLAMLLMTFMAFSYEYVVIEEEDESSSVPGSPSLKKKRDSYMEHGGLQNPVYVYDEGEPVKPYTAP
ncbi:unnamed protein product [Cyprideis torosa]|uniref:Uncharacterized protein n=1 Tax=Cyprideis torosa TaxID=163714 RepID=A0A7R8W1S2_9CRUS|nr:unnamed protein product [Cyprideis torosa]CAG0881274.1 unnamed protein product [Cyprideis torosa]